MDVTKKNGSSSKLIKVVIKDKYCPTSYNLKTDISHNEKSLFDFISNKKIKLKSYFDKKGTKKFLSDKEKAMEEIVLFDEIIDENKNNRNKSHHHHHHSKTKTKKDKYSHSKSEKKIYKIETHKSHKKKNKSDKSLKENPGMLITINYANDSNNNKNEKISNTAVNKNKIKPLSSISSNFSNIKTSEPLNLLINKNDSVIHSIVSEMGKVKN